MTGAPRSRPTTAAASVVSSSDGRKPAMTEKKRVPWNKKYRTKAQARKAQGKSHDEYLKRTTKAFSFRLGIEKDRDVIGRLEEAPSLVGYIRELVRADIERSKKEG